MSARRRGGVGPIIDRAAVTAAQRALQGSGREPLLMRSIQRWRLAASVEGIGLAAGALIGVWLIGAAAAQAQNEQEPAAEESGQGEVSWEEQPYIVKDGKVDFGTYNGWRRFEGTCARCHGQDAAGTTFAPALAESLKRLSYEQFIETVVNGRQVEGATGQSVMPPFGENPNVIEHMDDIYAYLEARADGALGRGRPDRLDPEQDPVWQERRG